MSTDTSPGAYTPPDDKYIHSHADSFIKLFTDFVNRHNGFVVDVHIDMDALCDCILRVHQRKYYFKTFHNMPKGLTEVKRYSLYCFWILKYKPFILLFGDPPSHFEKDDELWKWRKKYFLERFCLYLIIMIIRKIYKGVPRLPLSKNGIEDFIYSLRHHDITKEALTEMFEMLEDVIKLGHKTEPQPVVFNSEIV